MPKIHNREELKDFRKSLRNNLTKAEVHLWIKLNNSQLEGKKFRRQHSVGKYILDFYCPSEYLAIELDGSQHFSDSGKAKDMERDKYLKSMNIRVLRLSNYEVLGNMSGVLEYIKSYFTTPIPISNNENSY